MAAGEKPTHDLTAISGDGKSKHFVRIAPVWPTKSGDGYTGEIPAGVTITGRFAILPGRIRIPPEIERAVRLWPVA